MKKIEKVKLNDYDMVKLACKILGIEDARTDIDIVEDAMIEHLNMDLEVFRGIIERLLPLVDVGVNQITKRVQRGFVDFEKDRWLLMMDDSEAS